MSAAAHIAEKRCPRCRRTLPFADFRLHRDKPKWCCRECERAYNRALEDATRARSPEGLKNTLREAMSALPPAQLQPRDPLYIAALAIYRTGGFGALRQACEATCARIGRENIVDVTAEGWVV